GDVELGGDARVEAATRNRDGERVLGVRTAGFDALVAEDALAVVAHVEIVVDLDGLSDRGRGVGPGRVVMPRVRRFAHALGRGRWGGGRPPFPASAGREHAGTSTRAPASSTTQTRHTFTGVRFSAKQSVG